MSNDESTRRDIKEYYKVKMIMDIAKWKELGVIDRTPISILRKLAGLESPALDDLLSCLGTDVINSRVDDPTSRSVLERFPGSSGPVVLTTFDDGNLKVSYYTVGSDDIVPSFHGEAFDSVDDVRLVST